MRKLVLLAVVLMQSVMLFGGDYRITKLVQIIPAAINRSGQIAATLNIPGAPRAILWTRSGGAHDLGTLGGSASSTRDINESGQIVGMSYLVGDSATHAFLWTPGQGMQDLGTPGGTLSYAVKVNASGQVAGQWYDPTSQTLRPFVWTSTTGILDLGSPLGGVTLVSGFNAAGHVAFTSVSSNGQFNRAYLWAPETGAIELDTLGFASTGSAAINDLDQVVGVLGDGQPPSYAALWIPGSGGQNLGTLGGFLSIAGLINSSGVVAGYSTLSGSKQTHSFRWTSGGSMQDLGQLQGHPNSSPTAMNNKGTIVGVDAGTYVWNQETGMLAISAMRSPWGLNDAGQVIGITRGDPPDGVVATPTMKVGLVSSQNPSQAGQSVTFTATVTSVAGAPPDGEVIKFKDGAKVLASVSLNSGSASLTISTLTVGTHSVSATYAGDANYFLAKSVILKQVVNP